MERARNLTAFAIAIALSSCAPDADVPPESKETDLATLGVAQGLQNDTLGPVDYVYDPTALTRAEISLPLPPDFEETVFAVKFIPAQFLGNLGEAECSYESSDPSDCTAEQEIGFAMAYLERPIDTYGEPLFNQLGEDMLIERTEVAGRHGFTLLMTEDAASIRYTFIPVDDRTFLLVERRQSDVSTGEGALAQLRDSLQFPDR